MQRFAIIVFVAAVTLGGTARTSHAGLFEDMANGMVAVMEGFSGPMLEFTEQMTTATLRLSDDIGAMADRIGTMADRIGVMADRIVATEELLAETLLALARVQEQRGPIGAAAPVIMYKPRSGARAQRDLPPSIALSDDAESYVLYASASPVFAPGETLSILVGSDRELREAWQQIVMLSGDEVYIAAASINDMRLSGRSNSARIELVD